MNKQIKISNEALDLARRGYRIVVQRDDVSGAESYYAAVMPEFPFTIGTGESVEAAKSDLFEAVAAVIQSLLDDGLEVPTPLLFTAVTVTDPQASRFGFHDLAGQWMAHSPTPAITTPLLPVAA